VRDGRFATASKSWKPGLERLHGGRPDVDAVNDKPRRIAEADAEFARGEDRDFEEFAAEFARPIWTDERENARDASHPAI